MLTVACVLKSGGVYDASWVQRLVLQVSMNLSREHRVLCLSDIDVPGVKTIPLENNWKGWWSKIELFRPDLFDGPVLYLDLDCLITGQLDALCEATGFVMCADFLRPQFFNSSVMFWDRRMGNIYNVFKASAGAQITKYDNTRPQGRIGDQAFIEDNTGLPIKAFTGDLVRSYKVHCRNGPGFSSVVAFHGRPKPPQATGWAKDMWDRVTADMNASSL